MTIASCTCDQKLVRLFRSLYGSNSIGKDHFLQIGASDPFENARNAKNENQGGYRVYPISLGVDIANQTSTARRTGFKLLFQAPSSFPSKQGCSSTVYMSHACERTRCSRKTDLYYNGVLQTIYIYMTCSERCSIPNWKLGDISKQHEST